MIYLPVLTQVLTTCGGTKLYGKIRVIILLESVKTIPVKSSVNALAQACYPKYLCYQKLIND